LRIRAEAGEDVGSLLCVVSDRGSVDPEFLAGFEAPDFVIGSLAREQAELGEATAGGRLVWGFGWGNGRSGLFFQLFDLQADSSKLGTALEEPLFNAHAT
jgi:hypothetical protein